MLASLTLDFCIIDTLGYGEGVTPEYCRLVDNQYTKSPDPSLPYIVGLSLLTLLRADPDGVYTNSAIR